MKRSIGITLIGILFILGGVDGASGLTYVINGSFARQMKDLRVEFDATVDGRAAVLASPGEKAYLRREVRPWVTEISENLASPITRLKLVVIGGLHALGVVAGIGLLLLIDWARKLAIWQTFAVMLSQVWGIDLAFIYRRILDWQRYNTVEGRLLSLAEIRARWLADESGILWVFALAGAAWIGFVTWFLSRESVKAQFHPSTVEEKDTRAPWEKFG